MTIIDTGSGHQLDVAGLTDLGRKRSLNEDTFRIHEGSGLLIVADGMGGHQKGEVASAAAVRIISHHVGRNVAQVRAAANSDTATDITEIEPAGADVKLVDEALVKANDAINALNQDRGFPAGTGMGTTVVGMLPTVEPGRMVLFNVGDSRVYRFRDAELRQLTRDHTLYQEWLDGGGQGDNPPRNVITRAIGPKAKVENDVGLQLLVPSDLVLVCSDGLTGMVADPEISETLVRLDQATPDDICRALVDFANERGGKDNVTVIVGRYS